MKNLEYSSTIIRHSVESLVKKLLSMQAGATALVKLESGRESIDLVRVNSYEDNIKKELGEKERDYKFVMGLKDNKIGLVVERVK